MHGRDGELTLEGLAQRLETLERENERMRSENAALRSKVDTLEDSGNHIGRLPEARSLVPHWEGDGLSGYEGVSRRALLSRAGAAAVAAMAAGTLLYPRQAKATHVSTNNFTANTVVAHFVRGDRTDDFVPAVTGVNRGSYAGMEGINTVGGEGVRGESKNGTGVYGEGGTMGVEGTVTATGGTGVQGTGRYGVWGESNQAGFYGVTGRNTNTDGTGVRGVTNNTDGRTGVRGEGATGVWGSSSKTGFSGVYGQHTGTSGYGIVGDGKGGSAGVLGRNSGGEGVRGEGSTNAEVAGVRGLGTTGVWGSSARTGYSGLYGQHTGTAGYGVVGDGTGSTGAGVIGRNPNGPGIEGRDSTYGGMFAGSRAQLMLEPKSTTGKPTTGTHTKGEIYMDSNGTLFVCTAASNPATSTPATWRKVTTTAV